MAEFDEKELIRQVSTKPVLYDWNFLGYSKTSLRDRAWTEVGAAIHVLVYECKLKWRSLRDSFTKSYKRNRHQAAYYNEMRLDYRISPYQGKDIAVVFILKYFLIKYTFYKYRSGIDNQLRDNNPANSGDNQEAADSAKSAEEVLHSCLTAKKRFTPQQDALARLKIQTVLYETEFGN